MRQVCFKRQQGVVATEAPWETPAYLKMSSSWSINQLLMNF